MQRSIAIAQQSANPQGILGRIIAFIMSNAKQSFPAEVYTFFSEDEVSSMVKEAGFSINQCKKDSNSKRSLYWLVASKIVKLESDQGERPAIKQER